MSDCTFETLGLDDYDRAKRILNAARHPGYVGREMFQRAVTTGNATVAMIDGVDLGIAIIAKGKLCALSVILKAQGRGIGAALLARTRPRFITAIMDKVRWFEKQGYRSVGAPSVGANGKHATQLLERETDIHPEPIREASAATPATPAESKWAALPELRIVPPDEIANDEAGRPPKPLAPKQRRFVAEYMIDTDAAKAAARAGYTSKTSGAALLRKPTIERAVKLAMARREVRTEITVDRVLRELSVLAFSDVTNYSVDDDGNIVLQPSAPPGATRAISSIKRRKITGRDGETIVEVELRLWDKPTPLRLAGRHVGLFTDKIELTGKDGGPIRLQDATREEALKALAAVVGPVE